MKKTKILILITFLLVSLFMVSFPAMAGTESHLVDSVEFTNEIELASIDSLTNETSNNSLLPLIIAAIIIGGLLIVRVSLITKLRNSKKNKQSENMPSTDNVKQETTQSVQDQPKTTDEKN